MGQEWGVNQRSWHYEDSSFLCCSFGCRASTRPWNVVLTGSSRNPSWDPVMNRLTLHLILKGIYFIVKTKKKMLKALQGDEQRLFLETKRAYKGFLMLPAPELGKAVSEIQIWSFEAQYCTGWNCCLLVSLYVCGISLCVQMIQ